MDHDGQTNKLYLNDGTGAFLAGADVGAETDPTRAIAVGDALSKAMVSGGMSDSTLTVTGHTKMVMGKGGQTASALNFDGGIDRLMLSGGMDNTDVSVTGNATMVMLKDGLLSGSTIAVSGDVSKAMLCGPKDGDAIATGCTATFGSLSKMLMVKGNLAGTVDIQGSCVAAGKNSLLKILGNLSGSLIADLFGNVMVLGDFTVAGNLVPCQS